MAKKMKSENVGGRDDEMRKNIVRGLTGVAVTAGVLAVGAALANRKSRNMIKRGARRAFRGVSYVTRSVTSEGGFGRAVAHKASISRKHRRISRKKGMRGMREMGRAVAHRVSMGRRKGGRGRMRRPAM